MCFFSPLFSFLKGGEKNIFIQRSVTSADVFLRPTLEKGNNNTEKKKNTHT